MFISFLLHSTQNSRFFSAVSSAKRINIQDVGLKSRCKQIDPIITTIPSLNTIITYDNNALELFLYFISKELFALFFNILGDSISGDNGRSEGK